MKEQQQKKPEGAQTVRVRVVPGRFVRNEVTNLPIEGEAELPRTRTVERAIAAGDLEEIGGTSEPELEKEKI